MVILQKLLLNGQEDSSQWQYSLKICTKTRVFINRLLPIPAVAPPPKLFYFSLFSFLQTSFFTANSAQLCCIGSCISKVYTLTLSACLFLCSSPSAKYHYCVFSVADRHGKKGLNIDFSVTYRLSGDGGSPKK